MLFADWLSVGARPPLFKAGLDLALCFTCEVPLPRSKDSECSRHPRGLPPSWQFSLPPVQGCCASSPGQRPTVGPASVSPSSSITLEVSGAFLRSSCPQRPDYPATCREFADTGARVCRCWAQGPPLVSHLPGPGTLYQEVISVAECMLHQRYRVLLLAFSQI